MTELISNSSIQIILLRSQYCRKSAENLVLAYQFRSDTHNLAYILGTRRFHLPLNGNTKGISLFTWYTTTWW